MHDTIDISFRLKGWKKNAQKLMIRLNFSNIEEFIKTLADFLVSKIKIQKKSQHSTNKIINLGIMLKDYENGEEQKRYIDNNFSKHMAYIKVYSTNRGHLFNK